MIIGNHGHTALTSLSYNYFVDWTTLQIDMGNDLILYRGPIETLNWVPYCAISCLKFIFKY